MGNQNLPERNHNSFTPHAKRWSTTEHRKHRCDGKSLTTKSIERTKNLPGNCSIFRKIHKISVSKASKKDYRMDSKGM